MIQDMVIEESFSNNLFGFLVSYPSQESTVQEKTTVEVPLFENAKEDNSISPILEDIVHIEFVIGDHLDEQDKGPKLQDFIPEVGAQVIYPTNMIRGRIIF